jgi:peptide/nickel transport system substrate-binding protein
MRRLLALATLGLSACVDPGGGPPPAAPTAVRAALSQDPASLSLLGKWDRATEIVALQITDSLVRYDPELRLVPRVAESWVWSLDRKTIELRLREGVRWHDGAPVTADDVVFTVEKAREPAVENRTFADLFRDLRSIEAVDPRTIRARFERSSPGALEAFLVPLVPRHIAGKDLDFLSGAFARHPIGCGPFRFAAYRPGEAVELEANPDYWDGRPAIDRLVFRIYPDAATSYQALRNGELDILSVPAAMWEEAQSSPGAERFRAFSFSTLSVWPIVWNQAPDVPYFHDPRVRRALVHALDREEFSRTVARGLARPGVTAFHPESPWADPELEPRPYDPTLAARLLDEAGWVDSDGDGVRDRAGRAFRFTLLLPVGQMQLTRQIAEWEQQSWAALGVATEIRQLEWQAFRDLRNSGRFDAASYNLVFTPEPDQFWGVFHSTATSAYNVFRFADAEVDRLLEAGRDATSDGERRAAYHALQRRLYDLEAISCTFYFSTPVLHDRRLEGVTPSPIDYWRTTEGPRVWRWTAPPQ